MLESRQLGWRKVSQRASHRFSFLHWGHYHLLMDMDPNIRFYKVIVILCTSLMFVCMCVYLGGDLHYHLSQHGVFSEKEMRFYAAEIILGLEHMHNRFVVYRDLKVDPSF